MNWLREYFNNKIEQWEKNMNNEENELKRWSETNTHTSTEKKNIEKAMTLNFSYEQKSRT